MSVKALSIRHLWPCSMFCALSIFLFLGMTSLKFSECYGFMRVCTYAFFTLTLPFFNIVIVLLVGVKMNPLIIDKVCVTSI
jgi:hypothetical protein